MASDFFDSQHGTLVVESQGPLERERQPRLCTQQEGVLVCCY